MRRGSGITKQSQMEGASILPRKCEFCQGSFKDPKVLPCFHILCRECIRSLQVQGVEELKCPVNRCSRKFTCQDSDPESLPDATIVYHLQDLGRFKEKLKKDEIICDTCFDRERKKIRAVGSCDHCNYICRTCKNLHASKDEFSDHDVLLFLQLSQQVDDNLHSEVLKRSRSMSFVQQTRNKCKVHLANPNTHFCMDCKMYVCSRCIDTTHAKHNYKVTSRAFLECKDLMNQQIPSIQLKQNQVIEAVGYVEQRKDDVRNQKLTLSSSVDATFERLSRILDKRKQELKKRLDHLTDRKVTNLSAQQLELERTANEIERMVDYTERVLLSSTERELLTIYPFLSESIEQSSRTSSKLQPVETANTTFKVSAVNHLKEVCHRDLEIYSEQANPGTCSAEGEGLRSAQTLHYSQFTVNVVDKNRKPCPSIQDVVVKVKSSENEFESNALVHDRGSGRYRVSFCPEFPGPHEISVTVNGKSIPGSPFPLVVHMPRTQLGTARGSIQDVTQPRGITINPKTGKILVCEWNGNAVVEMDRIGRNRRLIGGGKGSSGRVIHPASVALSPTSSSSPFSSSGDIFVVEGAGAKAGVIKWNRDGKTLKAVCGEGTKVGQFNSPRGIKIGGANNHVYVCDRDNGRIQVFDLDLNFRRCIQLQDFGYKFAHKPKPNDLAFDQDGNIFVADLANSCIHRLTASEEYVFSFSQCLEGDWLAGPECVAVDSLDYLYVTESKNHRVSVFRTSGECVKVFGSKGKGEGEFNFPMGVAVDEYGSVFVCELLNNRIQVF